MADLSNEYYVLFPPSNYSLERIKPLNTKQDVERCETDIQLLTELNPVVKMLLAAQRKIKGTQKKKEQGIDCDLIKFGNLDRKIS